MIRIFNRLFTYRYNKNLFKKMLKNPAMGHIEGDSLKLINRFSIILLVTFIVRFVSRVYLMYIGSSDLTSFFKGNIISIIILFLIYTLFVNYLLGIGYRDKRIKTYSKKYVKVLFLILFYLIELIVSFVYFNGILYDYYWPSFLSILSIPVSLVCYIFLFAIIFDFCVYTTDNSDDYDPKGGEPIDYL